MEKVAVARVDQITWYVHGLPADGALLCLFNCSRVHLCSRVSTASDFNLLYLSHLYQLIGGCYHLLNDYAVLNWRNRLLLKVDDLGGRWLQSVNFV